MPERGIIADDRVNGALKPSGNALKLNPKFVSAVSVWTSVPFAKSAAELSLKSLPAR